MRKQIGKPKAARKGDLVTIVLRLPKGVTSQDARMSIWSALDGDEFSPHVQHAAIGVLVDSRPTFVPPMYVRLTGRKPRFTLQFTADEDLTFCIMQEIDVKDDLLARGRIRAHGKAYQRARRFLQDALRLCRGRAKDGIGAHR